MKIIKAKIYVVQTVGGTEYTYPELWLANKERISMVIYPNDRTDQAVDVKGTYQIVYGVVPNDLYTQMLSAFPEQFSVASRVEFEAYTDKHYPQKETVTDDKKVVAILAKAVLGQALTQAEKDSIDSTKPNAGINLSPRPIDIVIQNGATF